MAWSPQQDDSLKAIGRWWRDKAAPQVFYLAGFAGTGKTTIIQEVARTIPGTVRFAAFTGKAALVMRSKGCEGATTIHALVYRLDDDVNGVPTFRINHNGPMMDADLVIVDECSMVGEELGTDLLSFGVKVLVVGDPGQLPPVKSAGYFTSRTPDAMLTEVHRQARDNPIIAMSMTVREGGTLQPGAYGESKVLRGARPVREEVMGADQVLVGKNLTRRAYNDHMRTLKGFAAKGRPLAGDRLICLKNKRDRGLFNGGLFTVEKVVSHKKGIFKMRVSSLDFGDSAAHNMVTVPEEFFRGEEHKLDYQQRRDHDEFDFGYALTCHKAQGSQFPSVYIFDESASFREERFRWLYTAITRAAEKVTVLQ